VVSSPRTLRERLLEYNMPKKSAKNAGTGANLGFEATL